MSAKNKSSNPVTLQVEPKVRDFLKYKQAMDLAKGERKTINDIIKFCIKTVYKDELNTFMKMVKGE